MIQKRKYRIIAAFLLVVFSLNTILGFACSVGLDMGYNSKHHHDDQALAAVVHIHSSGKKYVHHEKHDRNNSTKRPHHERAISNEINSENNDCCSGEVRKFGQADKVLPETAGLVHPVFLSPFIDGQFKVVFPTAFDIVKDIKPFFRSYHPPIPDIRIAIRSFQIWFWFNSYWSFPGISGM